MRKLHLRKPSPALVIACIALFVALGPAAYASHLVVTTSDILDGEVRSPDLRDFGVTNTKLAANSIGTGKVIDGHITTPDLANGAVTNAKLGANSVDASKIANDASGADNVNATMLDGLDSAVFATQATVAALEARVAELEATLAAVSYDDAAKLFRFDGVNVQIVDGTGNTGDTPNGFGNLIVGYNESLGDTRTGSHNLVIGEAHTYTSYGGLIVGLNHSVTGEGASVTGGIGNTASGFVASVSGGTNNTASGDYASVSGGSANTASGAVASVSGGSGNTASGDQAAVSGGSFNTASGGSQWLGGTLNTRTVTVNVPGGDGNNAHWNTAAQGVLCDPGHLLLSGGAYWNTDVDGEELPLIYSRVLDGLNGWRARGGSDISTNRTLTVQALCLGP